MCLILFSCVYSWRFMHILIWLYWHILIYYSSGFIFCVRNQYFISSVRSYRAGGPIYLADEFRLLVNYLFQILFIYYLVYYVLFLTQLILKLGLVIVKFWRSMIRYIIEVCDIRISDLFAFTRLQSLLDLRCITSV